MTQTIYTAIKEDHDKHRKLLEVLGNKEAPEADRNQAWRDFYYDVKSHSAAEEESFYSPLMEKVEGQDHARHSVAEHKEMDDLMEEIGDTEFGTPTWEDKVAKLKHDYEHHMEEEENEIFTAAKDVDIDDEDGEIAEKFLKRKEKERKLVDEKAEASLEE